MLNDRDLKNNCESLDPILEKNNCNNVYSKELLFKILVIGDFGVGKTSIIRRYADGTFSSSYKVTIGADFAVKRMQWDEDTQITLHLWDIAGYERFGHLTGVYYRHARAAAIVFDLTRPETFTSVEKWLADLRRKIHLPDGRSIPVILLANKGDITIGTLPKEIHGFCRKHNILAWYITSAKDNVHIDEAMTCLICFTLNNLSDLNLYKEPTLDNAIHLNDSPDEQKSKVNCCQLQ